MGKTAPSTELRTAELATFSQLAKFGVGSLSQLIRGPEDLQSVGRERA